MRVRRKRRDLEKERIAITREPEIDEFLIALAEGRATLRLVTERDRIWLDEHGALDSFDVQPASRGFLRERSQTAPRKGLRRCLSVDACTLLPVIITQTYCAQAHNQSPQHPTANRHTNT